MFFLRASTLMTSGLGTMLLGVENVEQLTIMPNASCSILRAFSISLMASIFFDGTKVKRISLWLHLMNLTFILAFSRISEIESKAAIFCIDFLFCGCIIERYLVNSRAA